MSDPKPGTFIPVTPAEDSGPKAGAFVPATRSSAPTPPTEAPEPATKPGVLSNSPDDTWLSSAAKGTGTVLGKTLAGVAGLPGDIAGLLDYATTGIDSYVRDKPHDVLMRERAADIAKKKAEGQWQFPTSDEVYDSVANATGLGKYEATSIPGKYLMLAGEGAGSMLMPFGVAGKAVQVGAAAAKAGKGATSALLHGAGAALPGMGMGAAATAGAGAVGANTESPGAALLFGVAAPLAVGSVGKAYNAVRNPVSGAREKFIDTMAGKLDPATGEYDKRAMIRDITAGGKDTSPVGAPRTTAQAYEDPGLALAQLDAQQSSTATAQGKSKMWALQERQRQANQTALDTLAPENANPLALTDKAEAARGQLQTTVDQLQQMLSTERDPVAAAEIKRQIVDLQREAHDARVSAAYNSVDPEGVAQVPLTNTKRVAEQLLDSHDPLHGEMDPKLRGWLERLAGRNDNPGLGETTPYQRAVELDKAIEKARRAEARSGSGLDHEYGMLKSAIMDDLPNVQLPPTSAAAGVTPAETLRGAKDLYIAGKERFENPYVAADLKTKPYGEFVTKPEQAAKRIFPAGDEGARGVEAWLQAGGNTPEAVRTVQDIALARLHEFRQSGNDVKPLTAAMLDKWRNQYRGALSTLDGASPGFSTQFDNVTAAQRTLDNFMQSQVAQFLGMKDVKEVQAAMARMLTAPDGQSQITGLLNSLPDSARTSVREGLQRAAADHILDRFTGGTSGNLNGAQFAKYVRGNEDALRALFGNKFDQMRAVADELARYERTNSAGKTYGSNTGFNTRAELQRPEPHDPSALGTIATMGIVQPVMGNVAANAVAGYSGFRNMYHKLDAARQATIKDIVTDAIFDPAKARELLKGTYKLKGAGLTPEETLRGLADFSGSTTPNQSIPARAAVRGAQEGMSEIEARENKRRREGRKAGGRIGKLNHAAIAAGLIRAAEKAKKGHSATTEPLLNQPDEAITKALKVANEAI